MSMNRVLRQISRGTGIGMENLPENLQVVRDLPEHLPETRDLPENLPEIRNLPENLPDIRDLPENLQEIRVRGMTSTSPPLGTRPAEETPRRDNRGTYSLLSITCSLARCAHECARALC